MLVGLSTSDEGSGYTPFSVAFKWCACPPYSVFIWMWIKAVSHAVTAMSCVLPQQLLQCFGIFPSCIVSMIPKASLVCRPMNPLSCMNATRFDSTAPHLSVLLFPFDSVELHNNLLLERWLYNNCVI